MIRKVAVLCTFGHLFCLIAAADIVTHWNTVALDAIRASNTMTIVAAPGVPSRRMRACSLS
jgi:hypothetical protein